MSLDHQLSERVYRSLKKDVLGGVLGCGRLNLASLEARYSSSATPVREGLLRLVGEKLVDLLPQGGFGVHKLDRIELNELYELNSRLLGVIAAARAKSASPPSNTEILASSLSPPIDALFLAFAANGHSQILSDLIGAINDRLHCVRIYENAIFANTQDEYSVLKRASGEPKVNAFNTLLRAYHRRRARHADAIAELSAKTAS